MFKKNSSDIKQDLTSLSNAIIDTITDAILYITFNALTGVGDRSMSQTNYSMYQADVLLCKYNSKTIRKAINNLVSRRYLKRESTKNNSTLTITDAGIQRINEIIPVYKEKRPWDGYLYLISYDIPIKANTKRNLLRQYLRRIGCGKLQDSLWMTPYNPTGVVDMFVDDMNIPGTILVSKLGKDGAIGDEDRKTLINRVYGYEKLHARYEAFIGSYINRKNVSKTQLSLDYHSILKDDPQLPFRLEPDQFPAHEAHRLFRSILYK